MTPCPLGRTSTAVTCRRITSARVSSPESQSSEPALIVSMREAMDSLSRLTAARRERRESCSARRRFRSPFNTSSFPAIQAKGQPCEVCSAQRFFTSPSIRSTAPAIRASSVSIAASESSARPHATDASRITLAGSDSHSRTSPHTVSSVGVTGSLAPAHLPCLLPVHVYLASYVLLLMY